LRAGDQQRGESEDMALCAELRANVVKILSVATLLSARLKKMPPAQNQEITRVQRELDNERHARELAERDSLSANEKFAMRALRSPGCAMKFKPSARMLKIRKFAWLESKGEKQAEDTRRSAEKRAADQRLAADNLKQALSRFPDRA